MTQFKALRQGRGLTQQNIADVLGITRGAYANIENGKREPDFATLFTLANYFNVSIDYLLGCDTEKRPAPVSEDEPVRNVIKIAGRDGSYVEKNLTDEQIAAMKALIESLPDAPDDL